MDWLDRTTATLAAVPAFLVFATIASAQSPLPMPQLRLVDEGPTAPTLSARATLPADGGLPLTGRFTAVGDYRRDGMARLKADGSLGSTTLPTLDEASPSAVAEAPDGSIFLALPSAGKVLKLRTDGTLDVAGSVYEIMIAADGDLIPGGSFATIKGQSRPWLAKTSSVTGALRPAFAPAIPICMIRAMVRSGDDLYLACNTRLAKVHIDSGTIDALWQPASEGLTKVEELALSPDAASLYVLGRFAGFNGLPRINLAKLSTSGAGAADPQWRSDVSNSGTIAVAPAGWTYVSDAGTAATIRNDERPI